MEKLFNRLALAESPAALRAPDQPGGATSCGRSVVCLEVPAKLECRDIVLRAVSSACRLIASQGRARKSRISDFHTAVVTAVGEAYNNIVLHGYAGRSPGSVQMEIESYPDRVRIAIGDNGTSFDPSQVDPPDLDSLPESGLGIFVMRSMVDEMTYVAGRPNLLILVKRLDERGGPDAKAPGEGSA
jgi:serine/threonine-protein kinase RsbW